MPGVECRVTRLHLTDAYAGADPGKSRPGGELASFAAGQPVRAAPGATRRVRLSCRPPEKWRPDPIVIDRGSATAQVAGEGVVPGDRFLANGWLSADDSRLRGLFWRRKGHRPSGTLPELRTILVVEAQLVLTSLRCLDHSDRDEHRRGHITHAQDGEECYHTSNSRRPCEWMPRHRCSHEACGASPGFLRTALLCSGGAFLPGLRAAQPWIGEIQPVENLVVVVMWRGPFCAGKSEAVGAFEIDVAAVALVKKRGLCGIVERLMISRH